MFNLEKKCIYNSKGQGNSLTVDMAKYVSNTKHN